jgi:hypothetical protein
MLRRPMRSLVPWTAACVAFTLACGHTTHVRPTPIHSVDLEAEAGGPIFLRLGVPAVLPLSTVGASYGLTENLDLSAHFALTAALFGVAGFDVGSSYLAVREHDAIPAVSLGARLYGFSDFPCQIGSSGCGTETYQGARAYAELTATGSYLLAGHWLTYLGGTLFLQFDGGAPLFSFQAGLEYQFRRLALQLELRWYEPSYNVSQTVADWAGIANQGAVGVILGVRYRFGGEP